MKPTHFLFISKKSMLVVKPFDMKMSVLGKSTDVAFRILQPTFVFLM